ncbi:hypothetical protein H311_04700, partial [Anncaliia algerae PRA109]
LVKNITLDFPMVTNLIKPSLKGLYCGKVDFYYNEVVMNNYNKIDFIPDLTSIDKVKFSDEFCLVIEKDSLFNYLCNFNRIKDCLLVTGKGYPCTNTIKFLEKVNIPIFGLFDFDPYGLNIYLNYKKHVNIERIGLSSEDILLNNSVKNNLQNKQNYDGNINILGYKVYELIPLSKYDYSMIKSVENKSKELINELTFLKGLGNKIELEAMVRENCNFYEEYIKRKVTNILNKQ